MDPDEAEEEESILVSLGPVSCCCFSAGLPSSVSLETKSVPCPLLSVAGEVASST